MKHLIIVLSLLLLAAPAVAAPYLVCDVPPAGDQIAGVRGSVDGTAFEQPYKLQSGGLLIYDVGTLTPAKHSFTNIHLFNIRGESVSVPFDLPAVPGPPLNITLRP